eukprot:CAMPEP_0171869772 /NCGR_PEP_ID=MMETSP0992-20121227/32220_1 /TAXON_ID=483369 /ORGANISM="non described non described, Strain CCMP2098" /LENGTH=133 /DNA_ID=CAMNT_0012493735 /DNA_START=36 /DNA_END=437 /DNA_ORIENTATION=+
MALQPLKLCDILDDEAWNKMIEESQTKLCIIDIHLGWCGPCDPLKPMWTKMSMGGVKNCKDRIGFYSGDQQRFADKFKALCLGTPFTWAPKGCQPLFMMVKDEKAVAYIAGVNTPLIEREIDLNIPEIIVISD